MDNKRISIVDWCVAGVLGIGAFIVYLNTLSVGALPGQPVRYTVQFLGILPRLEPRNPLWWLAGKVAMALPVSHSPVTRLNVLSAFCGALTVALLYRLMVGFVRAAIVPIKQDAWRSALAARLAGLGAAAFLAFSVPFWMASTRTLPLTFDLALLVSLLLLLLRYLERPSQWFLYGMAFLFGVGIVEFSTLALFVPLAAIAVGRNMWEREEFSIGPLLLAALAGIVGLLLYPLVAFTFYNSEGFHLRDYTSFFSILRFMWRDQYYQLTRSLPKVGWLIVVLVTLTPALTVPVVARRALNREKEWAQYLLHAVLSVLAIGVLLNLRFAPWPMSEGRIQVTPYLVHAALFGYLLAYWFLLPLAWWERPEVAWQKALRVGLGWVFVVPAIACAVIAPSRNVAVSDGRAFAFVNRYAHHVLDSLEGRTWVVTDGSIDDHLRIAARERGLDVNVLNLYAQPSHISLRSVLDKLPSATLRNLASTDMMTLVHEWLRTDPEAVSRIAMMPVPDFWVGAGATVVPHRLVFLGSRDTAGLDPAAMLRQHEAFWQELQPQLDSAVLPDRWQPLVDHLRRHAGFVANNLGFLMQELGDDAAAFEAYRGARRIDPDNASALLNQAAMLSQGFEAADADAIRQDFEALKNRRGSGTRGLWSLSRYYGYVRSADAFGQLGFSWALSGRPGIAVSGLETALALATGDTRTRMQLTLADLYSSQDEPAQSEDLYEKVLAENPESPDALLGMSRLRRRAGKLAEAEAFLKRLDATGRLRSEAALEWARLNLAAGDVTQARITLEELVNLQHEEVRAWKMLGRIALAQDDLTRVEDAIRSLRSIKGADAAVYGLEAEAALKERDLPKAHRLLLRALKVSPRSEPLLEKLLRLEIVRGELDGARGHALQLLKLDPQNAWGNYALGSIHFQEGEMELAEDSLRRSLERRRLAPALNDLAVVLLRRHNDAEGAEALARESVTVDPRPHNGWDTLGMTLLAQDKLDQAEEALGEAVKRTRQDPYVYFHSAQLFARKGMKDHALELIKMLSAPTATLPPELKAQIEELRRELK